MKVDMPLNKETEPKETIFSDYSKKNFEEFFWKMGENAFASEDSVFVDIYVA